MSELFGDDAGGADFLEADFGIGMQVAANSGEFVGKTLDAVYRGHIVIRWRRSEVLSDGAGRKKDHSV